ncbi:hypothetical protein [Lacticaseibacillus thailandensis]|uniref:hypothetical protein n=1 Tax=Lacticaseibacillus thailandensis TaxID=381741 RepID=UPI0012E2E2EF|nr:hypothetical protein [Lacticaseibacillus thailandensis]
MQTLYFLNGRIIVERFHIVQLLGRTPDKTRIAALTQLDNHYIWQYKMFKSKGRLFHKADPHTRHVDSSFGLNEYMTEQNTLDIVFDNKP